MDWLKNRVREDCFRFLETSVMMDNTLSIYVRVSPSVQWAALLLWVNSSLLKQHLPTSIVFVSSLDWIERIRRPSSQFHCPSNAESSTASLISSQVVTERPYAFSNQYGTEHPLLLQLPRQSKWF
jgi:hypothetical protein